VITYFISVLILIVIVPPFPVASPCITLIISLVLGLLSKAAEIIYLKSGDIYPT
jgi:hypothetical protein